MSYAARWLMLSLPLVVACGDDADVAALDARVAALEAAADDSHAAEVAALEAEVTALAERLATAEASLAAVGAVDVTDLQADLDALEVEIDAAQASIATQAGQVSSLSTTVTSLQGTSSTQAAQIAGLNTSTSTLQSTVTTQGTQIGDLDTDLLALDSVVDALDGDLSGLAGDVDDLSTDLADLGQTAVRRQTSALTLQVPADHATLGEALAALDGLRLEERATIRLAAGTHTLASTLLLDHPQGEQIFIVGATGDPDDVIVEATTSGFSLSNGSRLGRIEDLTLSGTTGYALKAEAGAQAMLVDVRITGFGDGVNAPGGHVQALRTTVDNVGTAFRVSDAGSLDLEDVAISDLTGYGVHADGGSYVSAHGVEVTQPFVGFYLNTGSGLSGTSVSAYDPTNYGFELDGGSVLVGSDLYADQAVTGFRIVSGSVARVSNLQSIDNTGDGVFADGGSSVTLWEAVTGTISGNGRYGATAWGASFLDLGTTKPTGSTTAAALAREGSWLHAQYTGLTTDDVITPRVTDLYGFSAVYLP